MKNITLTINYYNNRRNYNMNEIKGPSRTNMSNATNKSEIMVVSH